LIRYLLALALLPAVLEAQTRDVFDAHFHHLGASAMQSVFSALDSLGVRSLVLIGTPAQLDATIAPAHFTVVKALTLPCAHGRMPNAGVACYGDGGEWPSLDSVRAMVVAGRVHMLGEINTQYLGIRPDDPRLAPYLALAEELDLPVGLHMGIGPPGVAYASSPFPPYKSPAYSGEAGNPLLLEPMLTRYPRLRVYVMHAGWPFADAMRYLLYMHPQLHVDISVLQYAIPRAAFEEYVRSLVQAGFGSRILFGSDGSPRRVKEGITIIEDMTFLSSEVRADILFNNASRFFSKRQVSR
jgi:uncharacterized protein